MARPTLHDVAAMPFPASLAAVRKYFDPYWAKFDFDEGLQEVCVSIDYEVTREETFVVTVEAHSIEAADQTARELLSLNEGKVTVNGVNFRRPGDLNPPQRSLFEALH